MVGHDTLNTPKVFEVTRSKVKVTVIFSCKTGLNVSETAVVVSNDIQMCPCLFLSALGQGHWSLVKYQVVKSDQRVSNQ